MFPNPDDANRYDAIQQEAWQSIEQISMPIIREFARHWIRLRGGHRAPTRTEFDPVDMKPFLQHLFLLDVVRPEMRFRGRLVGTMVVQSLGFDYTNRFLDEVIDESYYPTLRRDLIDVAENAVLHYRVMDMAWNDRPYARYHRLYVPLRRDSDRIDIIAGMACMVHQGTEIVPEGLMSAIIPTKVVEEMRIVVAD